MSIYQSKPANPTIPPYLGVASKGLCGKAEKLTDQTLINMKVRESITHTSAGKRRE